MSKSLIPKDISKRPKILQSELRKVYGSFEQVMEMGMTKAQNEVFLVIDEWWKQFGFGPSYRDIIYHRGKGGLGSTKKIVDRLVKIGAVKRVAGMGRSVRPTYINFRDIQ